MALEVENPQVGDLLDLFCDGELISKCLVVGKSPSYEYYDEEPTDKNQEFVLTLYNVYKKSPSSPTCHKVGESWPISKRIMERYVYTWKKAK
mgnify:CR=1